MDADGQTGRSQLRAPEFLMPSTRRQTVFDDLPEELKRFILNAVQKCPSHAATARAVCKTWDMIVRSQAPAEEAEPWLVLLLPRRTGSFIEEDFDEAGTCGGATVVEALKEAGRCSYTWLVDASTDKWYQVSLPLKLPATLCRMVGAGASRSGLLAISENWWAPNPSYWVGNPLTNKWRHILPSASSCRRYPQAGWATCVTSELIEERERGTYKIVQLRVCSRHTEDPTTGHAQLQAWPRIVVMTASTYDSATKSWNSGRGIGQHWGTFVCTCGSEGIIYILLMHPVENMELGRVMVTLMAYHVEAEKFSTAVPAKELAYRGEGIPVWRTMKLVANKLEIAIWIGIALHYSWPAQPSLDSLGIFRLDTASQRWVLDEPCRVNVATPGAGDCMNYNITPGSGSVSHLATMHTSCPILGELIRTQDAPLRSPTVLSLAKVPSQVKRDLLASASGGSATTIVPRFGAEP